MDFLERWRLNVCETVGRTDQNAELTAQFVVLNGANWNEESLLANLARDVSQERFFASAQNDTVIRDCYGC